MTAAAKTHINLTRAEVHFFWQKALVSVPCSSVNVLDVMLGANSDDQSQTYDQPWVAGKEVFG